MKHFLNKTLKVKQLLAIIFLALGTLGIVIVFSTGGDSISSIKKNLNDTSKSSLSDTSSLALKNLNKYVDSLSNAEQLFGGSWSFYLTDIDSGKTISAVDINLGLVPASVMKVVTTGTALSILGPGYRFATSLRYDGSIDVATKTLNGNIYIHGGGDPTLGSETFGSSIELVEENWIKEIKKLGIDSINGSVIGDAQSFDLDPVPVGWTWEDMQSDYGTGTCGLNFHENIYNITLTANKSGVNIKTSPQIPGMKLYNQVLNNPKIAKAYAYVQGSPFQFERTIFGEVGNELEERGAIPDPALFCAQSFQSALIKSGIKVKDSVATTLRLMRLNNLKIDSKENKKTICTTLSPPLSDLVFHTNQISQNFYAESILRAISLNENGFGAEQSSASIIYKYWKDHKVDLRGLCMVDGCGLSRMNTISTHQLVDMLRVYAKNPAVFPSFYKSLPIAGESGTIRKLAHGTLAENNLRAKSGTMARVKSYAGYVTTKSGKLLCFAMIGNNTGWNEVELKFKFERLFELMAELE